MGVSEELYEFLISQLVSSRSNNLEMQRITSILHELLFKSLSYQIRAVPNRQTEEYIQRKSMEFNSRDIAGE